MLLAIEGEEATGKTTLAYTGPRPIVGFAFDMGVERALYGAKHQELFGGASIQVIKYNLAAEMSHIPKWEGYDITIYELPQPIQLDTIRIKGAIALWTYFIQLCVKALMDDYVRTIVVDTMTVARRVKADAYLQGLQEAQPENAKPRERLIQIEYGATNDAIRGVYTTSAGTRKNLVATHHLTDERKESVSSTGQVNNVLTGRRILEGLAQTYRFVDVVLRCEKAPDRTLMSTLQKCGYNLSLEGMPLPNATWNMLCSMIEGSLGGQLELEKLDG